MLVELGLGHFLVATFAADIVVQATLLVVFPPDGKATGLVFAFHRSVRAVDGDVVLHLPSLQLRFAAALVIWAFDNQIVQYVDQYLGGRRARAQLRRHPTSRTVAFWAQWRISRPSLTDTFAAETVVAVHQQHRVDQRAATYRTHQVVVIFRDVIQIPEVDGRVELGIASLLRQVVSLLHVTACLESAHVAEGYLRRNARRSPRRAPAGFLRRRRQACVTRGSAGAALLRLDGGVARPGGGSGIES